MRKGTMWFHVGRILAASVLLLGLVVVGCTKTEEPAPVPDTTDVDVTPAPSAEPMTPPSEEAPALTEPTTEPAAPEITPAPETAPAPTESTGAMEPAPAPETPAAPETAPAPTEEAPAAGS